MQSNSLLSKGFNLLFLLISLTACSRYIEGEVFLDKNANNIRDPGESVVAGMPFTVTRNNANFKAGVTDSLGHFSVGLGIGTNEGNFCAQVRQEDVAAFKSLRASAGKALEAETETPEPTSEACAKDEDGAPDCSDPNCCDETECESDSACKDEEDKNACPKDNAGKPECDDSRCADEPACNTYSVKSGQSCDQPKSTSMVLNLDVPLAIDYETRLTKLSKKFTPAVSPGDKVGIEITFPASCVFDPYVLPAPLLPQGLGDAYHAETRELFLAKAIAHIPSQLINRDVPPFGHDALYTYILVLNVADELGLKDSELTVQPTLTCPDGRRVAASANVIPFKSSATNVGSFKVESEISPKCPEVGESATITAVVENGTPQGFQDGIFTLVIGGESHISMGTLPDPCKNKGESIECDLSGNPSAEKVELAFPFTLEDGSATVSFAPKLDAAGAQFTDSAIICSYP